MQDHPKPAPTLIRFLWNMVFALFYPFILTFSLLFTGLLWVFSGLSQVLVRLLSSFPAGRKAHPEAQAEAAPPQPLPGPGQ